MLSKSEQEWLERREESPLYYTCLTCEFFTNDWNPETAYCDAPLHECPFEKEDFRDAANFEARVGPMLAEELANFTPCTGKSKAKCAHPNRYCTWCRLKYARIAVEAEM